MVFLAKAKDGDYHQEMNGATFLNWLKNQLMPALKSPRVIVSDNACSPLRIEPHITYLGIGLKGLLQKTIQVFV